jgi:signal transduction histidine kinase
MKEKPDQDGNAAQERLSRENARLRGDLLTVARRISHDLRTPVGGIITTSEMLKEILADNSPSSASFVSPILESAEGLSKLIENVSFLLKASVNPPAKERVKMGEVVFRVLQLLESKILKKNAKIIQPETWPEVDGVFSWLEVIWRNLLANALQHGKDRIEFGWQQQTAEFQFHVCDDGNGVPPEKRPALFQPFHTLHELGASGGLGLAMVQRLVELQNGNCGYKPGREGGSDFYFTLPSVKS